jgi:hypothetical protein
MIAQAGACFENVSVSGGAWQARQARLVRPRMRPIPALLALALAGCATASPPPGGEPVAVSAKAVPLDATDPGRTLLGRLRYLGGIELESRDARFGGLSSLKWRGGRLWAVTDKGDWAVLDPVERGGRLEGLKATMIGDLLGPDGGRLEGTDTGDAESLAPDGRGWLVAFEHDHKILRYRALGGRAEPSGLDPQAIFGELDPNKGVEALAARGAAVFLCAERLPTDAAANCVIRERGGAEPVRLPPPPGGLDPLAAFPVDADWAGDGTLYILYRSWSGGNDNRAAVVARSPLGDLRTLATFLRPTTLDNYEGLTVREERGRTFLYIASDDNFGEHDQPGKPETWQRTLLLKFELIG